MSFPIYTHGLYTTEENKGKLDAVIERTRAFIERKGYWGVIAVFVR
jgi:hypothetical protein